MSFLIDKQSQLLSTLKKNWVVFFDTSLCYSRNEEVRAAVEDRCKRMANFCFNSEEGAMIFKDPLGDVEGVIGEEIQFT